MKVHGFGGSRLPVRLLFSILTIMVLHFIDSSWVLAQDDEDDDVDVIEIIDKVKPDSERAVIMERLDEIKQTEAIGNEQMSKLDVSDAGGAVQKLPAVTLKGGEFAYIRGLGERYSQTLFNGSSIPSPEPDKRVVPLSLFPAGLLEKIVITKTYSPDTPGEFSGGSVQIHSKGIPDEPFLKFGLGLKYNSLSTLKDFETYEGGNYDTLTFNDNTRKLPSEIPNNIVRVGDRFSAQDVQEFGRSFNNIWNVETMTAPPAHKLDLTFGDSYSVGDIGKVGILGAVNWSNTYSVITDEKYRILKNFGTIENPDPRVFNDFNLDTYKFTSELSTMLNFTYEMSETQKVGIRNFYTRAMDDRVRFQTGLDGQQGREIRVVNFRNIERSLLSSQLFGEHLLVGDIYVNWRTSYSLSQRDEPDRRSVRYDLFDGETEFELVNVSDSGSRDFYQLDENIFDGGLDIAIPLPWIDPDPEWDELEPDQKFKFGGAYVVRDRDFDSRRFRYIPSSIAGNPIDEDGNVIDQTADPESIFRATNINPSGFILTETTRSTDNYQAEQLLLAGYGLIDFDIIPDLLRLEAGIRYEKSVQEVTTFELFGNPPQEVVADLDEGDFLPAFNLTYNLAEKHLLRLAGSRTVSRPEFRELAEFQFNDVVSGFVAKGNKDLERATILNADLRWEWFPNPGELISTSLFFKRFDSPIEKVIIPTGSAIITSWDNADTADLYGFEIEIRKSLGFLNQWFVLGPNENESILDDFNFIANFAWIESEVEINEGGLGNQTNNNRPLEGQPDYVLNIGMLYDNRDLGLTVALFANTFGESISQVGAFGLPDEKEQPRWSLDLSISKKFGPASLKLSAQNLLDDEFTYEQGGANTIEYKKGISVGLSYSYTF